VHTPIGIRILLVGTAALALLSAGGCKKKLTFERWEALPIGESKADVRSALGKPLEDRGTRLTYANQDDGIAAEAWFDPQTGRLTYTHWADPIHGMREKGARPER
jgi:hypothetical protein